DEQDETVVLSLAAAAGIAVDNARLFESARLGEAWRGRLADVVSSLLSGTDTADVLRTIAAAARELTQATQAVVLLSYGAEGQFHVAATDGEDSAHLGGFRVTVPAGADAADVAVGQLSGLVNVGPWITVPLGDASTAPGVLVVYGREGVPPFRATVQEMLSVFATQTAVAIELAQRRRDAERLSVYEDRDRIARNLHDLVIQRLFAVGMSLECADRLVEID